ncbi:MAG: hypothetical protein KAT12_07745, partial [Gammaproteobacteria bacterium]|nr:hypothetical protein [Gammaproteobacteria bacterium]
PSYMVDTLRSLKDDFPDEDLYLIIGMDAFFGITSWFKWRSIFELCHLVVTTRPGFDRSEIKGHMDSNDYLFLAQRMTTDVNAFMAQESPQEMGKILLQSVPQLDISSTRIRNMLQDGDEISQWMPQQAYEKLRGFF